MTKEEFLKSGLIEQHVLGLTSPEEEQMVQHFLQQHPELMEEVEGLHSAMHQYASQYTIPAPDAMGTEAPPANMTSLPRTAGGGRFWLYTLLLVFAGGCFWLFNNNQQQQQDITQLEAEYAALDDYCDKHTKVARAAQALIAKTNLPTTQRYVVGGTTIAPAAFAIAYWNPDLEQGWLDPTKLPQLPADRQYQIWADVHGEMISIGLIPKDDDTLVTINFLDEAESINITQEVLGGVDHPTVDLLTANGYL